MTGLNEIQVGRTLKGWIKELRDELLQPEISFRFYLRLTSSASRPVRIPNPRAENSVLRTKQEWQEALAEARELQLPPHKALPKNWDSLTVLSSILRRTRSDALVLDAGGEKYSQILPWLYLYGYRNLRCVNLAFRRPITRGPISYEPGDITRTRFRDESLDAITCLSVLEHGVPLPEFFHEASRILKPGGLLFISTDYYPTPIDTRGLKCFGVPIHIFTAEEILHGLEQAAAHGLYPTSTIHLECAERPVRWEEFALDFTYLMLTLQKLGSKKEAVNSDNSFVA